MVNQDAVRQVKAVIIRDMMAMGFVMPDGDAFEVYVDHLARAVGQYPVAVLKEATYRVLLRWRGKKRLPDVYRFQDAVTAIVEEAKTAEREAARVQRLADQEACARRMTAAKQAELEAQPFEVWLDMLRVVPESSRGMILEEIERRFPGRMKGVERSRSRCA